MVKRNILLFLSLLSLVLVAGSYFVGLYQTQKTLKQKQQHLRLSIYLDPLADASLWPEWQQKLQTLTPVEHVELLQTTQVEQRLRDQGISDVPENFLPRLIEITPRTFQLTDLDTLKEQVRSVVGVSEVYFDRNQVIALEHWQTLLQTLGVGFGVALLLLLGFVGGYIISKC